MKFEEAVNKFNEKLKGREEINKSAIEFTIRNLRHLIDFGEMQIEEKETLSDKRSDIIQTCPDCRSRIGIRAYLEEDVKQALKEVKAEKIKKEKQQMDGTSHNYIAGMDYIISTLDTIFGDKLI